MSDTRRFNFTIAPGGVWPLHVVGDRFVITRTTGPVDVRWMTGELRGLEAGEGYDTGPVDKLFLANNNAGAIAGEVLVADRNFISNRIAGAVSLDGFAAFTNANVPVGTASGLLVAAKVDRRYLLVQNKHATATVWIGFAAGVTQANGVKLPPGGAYETGLAVHTGALYAIGDAANADVVVVEG